jgi:Escherichia/Staphylococcus phage prohead protease
MNTEQFFDALALVPNLRSAQFDDVEMVETAKGFKFDGIAAPTGVSADLGDFTEEYERGTFRRFLSGCKDNIPFLHEHNPRDLLATTRSGRLRLSEDGKGLRAQADVVKTDLSERIKALVDSQDIGGMSIGMVVGAGNARIENRGRRPHRQIQNLKKILDVCTTFDPAYVATEAQFRSMTMQFADSPESLQQLLMGAYPQLQGQGDDTDGTQEEEAPADEQTPPDGADDIGGEGDESGVAEQRSVAARKRALSFYLLTHGGVHDET